MKWVVCGSPGAGTAVKGFLDVGCHVLCLADDAHHKEHLMMSLEKMVVASQGDGTTFVAKPKQVDSTRGQSKKKRKQAVVQKSDSSHSSESEGQSSMSESVSEDSDD